jgi:hypothetical protein
VLAGRAVVSVRWDNSPTLSRGEVHAYGMTINEKPHLDLCR